jgi:hypothetical protein
MATLSRRVDELEQAHGPGECACQGLRVVFENDWRGEMAPEPEICPSCGLPRPTLTIRYTDDWRRNDD